MFSDELRARANEQDRMDNVRGYSQALRDLADEIDERMSGRIIYDQRNQARAEAAMWRGRYERLRQLLTTITEQGDELFDARIELRDSRPEDCS